MRDIYGNSGADHLITEDMSELERQRIGDGYVIDMQARDIEELRADNERLRAENERLRAAMAHVLPWIDEAVAAGQMPAICSSTARAALAK